MKISSTASLNFNSIKPHNKNANSVPIVTSSCQNKIPDAYSLNSKFNINFCSLQKVKAFNLDDFSHGLENKINNAAAPNTVCLSQIRSAITSSSDIDLINEVFKNDRITNIYQTSISLNAALDYLAVKNQIRLTPSLNKKTAFMIDKMSIDFIKNLDNVSYKKFLDEINGSKIVLYCYSASYDEAQSLAGDFQNLTGCPPDKIKIIDAKNKVSSHKCPDAAQIKKIILSFADYKFPNDEKSRRRLIEVCCKYLNDCFLSFSYEVLANELKEQYTNIENVVVSMGKTMDDVIYVIPQKGKSYDLINYIYAAQNNIDAGKFMLLNEIKDRVSDDEAKDKVYVVLDDVSISGSSLLQTINNFYSNVFNCQKGNKLIISPLVYTPDADMVIGASIYQRERESDVHIKFVPKTEYKTLGYVDTIKTLAPNNAKNLLNEYLKNFKNLDENDINFMLEHVMGGCGNQYACLFLPYMIPDNSSELSALFGGCFLNNDSIKANKGIDIGNGFAGMRIKYEDYQKLKKIIK